jgi:hypothetical protein
MPDTNRVNLKVSYQVFYQLEAAMKLRKQSGQVLVGAAIAMVVLAGFAGLAIDMGTLRYQKRLQQTAADAAAIAGASNLTVNSGVTAGATNSASQNGFTDLSADAVTTCTAAGAAIGTVCVQVNNPPQAGPHAADAKYVEVLVAEVQPTYFMKIFGVNSQVVTARAVATNTSGGGPNNGCLYTLGPPNASIEGVNINGNATLNAITCGISDNGNFNTKGNALQVNAGSFGVTGDANQSGPGGSVTCTAPQATCPVYGVPPASDPTLTMNPPLSPPAQPGAGSVSGNNYSPGTFNGIHLTGNGTVNFAPGIYYMTGDFTCNGTPGITGTGVMFYFTNGSTWNCAGNDNINLSAPAAGQPYAGILMYQDPNDTNGPSVGGNVGSTYQGLMYFPKSQITFFGNSNSIAVGIVIADAFALSGHPTVNLQGQAGMPTGVNLLTNAVLVE